MPAYQPPLRDLSFVLEEVLDVYTQFAKLPGFEDTTPDLGAAFLTEAGKFSEEVLAPLNRSGDEEGCHWSEDGVTAPSGFRDAYQQYVALGFPAFDQPTEFGGQGMPGVLGLAIREMLGTANWAWSMYPGLSHGCMHTIDEHGTPEQRATYLPKLVTGEWTGTMCLTESHCGTDLGMLRTKAEPRADGSYAITGTKIFISSGDHDMADNIVHVVLARLPDAPGGTKGISLFIVPKFLPAADGGVGARNGVACGSLEHKMGIHGNATCVMNFDGATGYLIGEENKGLNAMFTFMNAARIGTGQQGLAHAEFAFQNSLSYARERLQMRSLTGPKNADGPADPIIVHPDVRRMLLTQKAFAEGGRAFALYAGQLVDVARAHPEADERQRADDLLALLTPILKAFLTEVGFEAANHGLQCFGGHGYIAEWGMEQNVRDARISMLYEGTTGIQALDLLGRKVLGSRMKLLNALTDEIGAFCKQHARINSEARHQIKKLAELNKEWRKLTRKIGMTAMKDREIVGSASVDYLMYSGYVCVAYLFAKSSIAAQAGLDRGSDAGDEAFYTAKLQTAEFYYRRILPRTKTLAKTMLDDPKVLLQMGEGEFALGL
ncbi:MAG: acyl-CoA dehydrogenase C-terminal domain-containing protein [Pseudomonadota bacterium]